METKETILVLTDEPLSKEKKGEIKENIKKENSLEIIFFNLKERDAGFHFLVKLLNENIKGIIFDSSYKKDKDVIELITFIKGVINFTLKDRYPNFVWVTKKSTEKVLSIIIVEKYEYSYYLLKNLGLSTGLTGKF